MRRTRTKRGPDGGPLERQSRATIRAAAASMARLERACARSVAAAAEAIIACLQNGGTVFFCGNGGSAADAQHLACELAGRYFLDRPALAAIALTTNTSSLTAIGNDFGFDDVFSRQLEGLGTPGDVLVAITTSGTSPNVLRAVEVAHALGMVVIGMTGSKGADLVARSDLALVTPNAVTPRVQEGHLVMGHAFCELVERAMFGPGSRLDGRRPGASRQTRRPPAPRPAKRRSTGPRRAAGRGRA